MVTDEPYSWPSPVRPVCSINLATTARLARVVGTILPSPRATGMSSTVGITHAKANTTKIQSGVVPAEPKIVVNDGNQIRTMSMNRTVPVNAATAGSTLVRDRVRDVPQ